MLDSALEPSYNSLKNLLLLPGILKLIVDMVNYSTPLIKVGWVPPPLTLDISKFYSDKKRLFLY